ncbi:MAG: class I SAM-dependent methyltransferase [Acidobacteria bacterium]|nr:class I SAM-dependent methyltransferase [Acidobacteriota bacterium]
MPKDKPDDEPFAIRHQYEEHGVEGYYSQSGSDYRNPHEPIIREVLRAAVEQWQLDLMHVLDLACGSGEVTLALRELGSEKIDGIDPHTGEAYLARTGQEAESFNFEQIAEGALSGRRFSLIICSFALHLIDVSWLAALLAQLGLISDRLLILTPHKRPELNPEWGWTLEDEMIVDRVRARLYRKV